MALPSQKLPCLNVGHKVQIDYISAFFRNNGTASVRGKNTRISSKSEVLSQFIEWDKTYHGVHTITAIHPDKTGYLYVLDNWEAVFSSENLIPAQKKDLRLLVFDVDGTLADWDSPVGRDISGKLCKFEAAGVRIAFVSGRSIPYLEGFARGMGIKSPLLAGEYGCVIFNPNILSETLFINPPDHLLSIKREILSRYGDAVYVPINHILLTFHIKNMAHYDDVERDVREMARGLEGFKVITFFDAIEIVPEEIQKSYAIQTFKSWFGFTSEQILAVGDAPFDLAMQTEVDEFYAIGNKIKADCLGFEHIADCLDYMEKKYFFS